MLTLKNFPKVLVEYKRKPSKFTAKVVINDEGFPEAKLQYIKGDVKGIVVAIGPNIIGWALCDKKDKFSYEFGMDLALRRALIAQKLSYRNRGNFYATIPTTMLEYFKRMDDRSEKYFGITDSE